MADVIDVDMPTPAAPPPPQQKKRQRDVIDLLEDDDVVFVSPPKKAAVEVVDVDALDSEDDADDNGERGLGPPRVKNPAPPRAIVKADPCPPQRPMPKQEPRGAPLVAKREPKQEAKPKVERKPKVEDGDGDQPMFVLKKKQQAAAPSPLSEAASDDDEPREPPPPRSFFPQWLKAREDKGEAPPLDPDQRRACDCVVVQGKNTFVTGSGGNGKSHVTRTIQDFFAAHYGDAYSQRVAVCAPTGIAATHVNGTTIHSATGIGVPKCQEDFRRMHQGFRKELWTKLVEVLIVDEISMLSGEWLDNLERTLRELTHYHGRGAASLDT